MNELEKYSKIEELTTLLATKKKLYDQMLSHEKEFEEVKTLFIEIREIEKLIQEKQMKDN